MKRINFICVLSVLILTTSLIALSEVAQAQMRVDYPNRFHLFGVVELSYRNFYVETTSNRYSIDRSNQTFRQYYKAGVEGFIYHPRLAIFSASISYNDVRFFPKKGQDVTTSDIGYDIQTTFLPYRPVAFDFYARKIDYTFDYAGDPVDTSSLLYGARLRMHIRDYLVYLGHKIGETTVKNILLEHGYDPEPDLTRKITWKEFLKSHWHVFAACDLFAIELFVKGKLVRYMVFFAIHVATRKVEILGVDAQPNGPWMEQIARNVSAEGSFLAGKKYLIHDRDPLYTEKFDSILQAGGVEAVKLPPRSPNLNPHAERFVRSAK